VKSPCRLARVLDDGHCHLSDEPHDINHYPHCPTGEKECEILLHKNMRSVVFRSMTNSISGTTGKAHPTL